MLVISWAQRVLNSIYDLVRWTATGFSVQRLQEAEHHVRVKNTPRWLKAELIAPLSQLRLCAGTKDARVSETGMIWDKASRNSALLPSDLTRTRRYDRFAARFPIRHPNRRPGPLRPGPQSHPPRAPHGRALLHLIFSIVLDRPLPWSTTSGHASRPGYIAHPASAAHAASPLFRQIAVLAAARRARGQQSQPEQSRRKSGLVQDRGEAADVAVDGVACQ